MTATRIAEPPLSTPGACDGGAIATPVLRACTKSFSRVTGPRHVLMKTLVLFISSNCLPDGKGQQMAADGSGTPHFSAIVCDTMRRHNQTTRRAALADLLLPHHPTGHPRVWNVHRDEV